MRTRSVVLSSVLSAALAGGPGCVATNVQKAPADTPPAFALNLPGTPNEPLQAQLDTVIVFEGPGSWKRRAYWDEYVLAFANVGSTPLKLLDARLYDAHGVGLQPGGDWEALERESADWFKRNATVENVALGAGLTVLHATAGASVFVAYVALMGGFVPILGVAAGTALVSAGAAYLLDRPSKDGSTAIAAEFSRRRLDFPVALLPGQTHQASLFFRITPSPQRLILTFESGARAHTATIDLTMLSDLHRKPSRSGR